MGLEDWPHIALEGQLPDFGTGEGRRKGGDGEGNRECELAGHRLGFPAQIDPWTDAFLRGVNGMNETPLIVLQTTQCMMPQAQAISEEPVDAGVAGS